MTHRQHYTPERINTRCEAAAGFLLAIAIGIGLAAALVAWWSA